VTVQMHGQVEIDRTSQLQSARGWAARDAALVEAARGGSPEAFALLVCRYRPAVARLAYRLTHDAEEAKDIAQETFLRAFRRLDELRPERPFAPWLFVVARNASLDAIRRRRGAVAACFLTAKAALNVFELTPDEIVLRNDEERRVHAALAALPPKYRDVLALYYISDLRYREIALALDIPLGTVKTYISRAKVRLRVVFDEQCHGRSGKAHHCDVRLDHRSRVA